MLASRQSAAADRSSIFCRMTAGRLKVLSMEREQDAVRRIPATLGCQKPFGATYHSTVRPRAYCSTWATLRTSSVEIRTGRSSAMKTLCCPLEVPPSLVQISEVVRLVESQIGRHVAVGLLFLLRLSVAEESKTILRTIVTIFKVFPSRIAADMIDVRTAPRPMSVDSRPWLPAVRPRTTLQTEIRPRKESITVGDKFVRCGLLWHHSLDSFRRHLPKHFGYVGDLGFHGMRYSTRWSSRVWSCIGRCQ